MTRWFLMHFILGLEYDIPLKACAFSLLSLNKFFWNEMARETRDFKKVRDYDYYTAAS